LQTELIAALSDTEIADRAKVDGPHGPWSHEAGLLAAVLDAVNMLTHALLAVNGGKGDPPTPLRRPGVVDAKSRSMNPQEIAYLERIRDIHAQTQAAAEQQTEGDGR
jgi:hypothetical protein